MSVVRLAMAVPASTTPLAAERRWRSQADGSTNQAGCAVTQLVASVAAAPARAVTGLFESVLRMTVLVVTALYSIELL